MPALPPFLGRNEVPGSFGAAIFFVVLGIAVLVAKRFVPREAKKWLSLATGVAVTLAALLTLQASWNIVPVRNVGIVTSFNKPTGETTGSGLHFVAPWQKVENFDASIQTADNTNPDPKASNGCTTVRIGSMATACVENKVRWQVNPADAPRLFNDYKGDFENLRKNLFDTELQNALNDTFADYNPLANVDINTGQVNFDGIALADELRTKLSSRLGSDITIHAVTIPLVHHDGTTESNIKQFSDVVAQKRILEQKNSNAETEKRTAEKIQNTLSDPYLRNKCLDLSEKLNFPPGYCMMTGGIINASR